MRVLTRALMGFLSDLIHTADRDPEAGPLGAVLVHTGRGSMGVTPGEQDLLCGASTDRFVAGHTYIGADGQLPAGPSLWSVRDCASLIAVFKASAKRDEFHAVVVTRVGQLVTVAEDPNLFDDGLSLSFAQLPLSAFPGPMLYQHLDRTTATEVQTESGSMESALPRTDVSAPLVASFAKIAERRRMPVRMYRTHQREAILVQIGPHYRGVLMPARYEPDGDERRPDAEVHSPDIGDLMRRMQDDENAKPGPEREHLTDAPTVEELNDLFTAAEVPVEPAPARTLDEVVANAAELVITTQSANTSLIQRKLRVGFARATRLLDDLQELGVVGPPQGVNREVLATAADLPAVLDKIRARGAES